MTRRYPIPTAALAAALFAAAATPASVARDASNKDFPSLTATTICTPVATATFDTRVHVRCSAAVSGILYFAVATSDSNRAARALALFSTAQASGRDLRIYYDPANTSGSAIGCATGDCRLADAVEML